jgi:hypothetical protein
MKLQMTLSLALLSAALFAGGPFASAAGTGIASSGGSTHAVGSVAVVNGGVDNYNNAQSMNLQHIAATGFSQAGHTGSTMGIEGMEYRTQGGGKPALGAIGHGTHTAGARGTTAVHAGTLGTGIATATIGGQGG